MDRRPQQASIHLIYDHTKRHSVSLEQLCVSLRLLVPLSIWETFASLVVIITLEKEQSLPQDALTLGLSDFLGCWACSEIHPLIHPVKSALNLPVWYR